MRIDVRYAGWDERALAMGLVDRLWRAGHRLSYDADLFDWMFKARRHLWDHDGYSFALASNGDEPVGIHAAIPFRLNVFGEEKLGLWRMIWIAVQDARAGNAGLLLHRAFDRPPYVNVSFGINDVVTRIYTAMNFSVLPDIPRHFAVLPGGEGAVRALLHIAYKDWDEARVNGIVAHFLTGVPSSPDAVVGLPVDWDAHGWSAIAPTVVGATRDHEYLKWRYVDHPRFAYRVVSVREREVVALAVWRAETIMAPGQAEPLCRMGRVVEFLVPDLALGPRLCSALLRDMVTEGMAAADYYGYHHGTGVLLDELGFRVTSSAADGGGIPSRFQPLDGGGGRLISALRAPGLPVPSFPPTADCRWLWTKGDSDQDRPN